MPFFAVITLSSQLS